MAPWMRPSGSSCPQTHRTPGTLLHLLPELSRGAGDFRGLWVGHGSGPGIGLAEPETSGGGRGRCAGRAAPSGQIHSPDALPGWPVFYMQALGVGGHRFSCLGLCLVRALGGGGVRCKVTGKSEAAPACLPPLSRLQPLPREQLTFQGEDSGTAGAGPARPLPEALRRDVSEAAEAGLQASA